MDSIKFLMLISRIEKKFNIEITFEDLQIENVSTFSALANTIYKYLK
jgi:acyl carrier protein